MLVMKTDDLQWSDLIDDQLDKETARQWAKRLSEDSNLRQSYQQRLLLKDLASGVENSPLLGMDLVERVHQSVANHQLKMQHTKQLFRIPSVIHRIKIPLAVAAVVAVVSFNLYLLNRLDTNVPEYYASAPVDKKLSDALQLNQVAVTSTLPPEPEDQQALAQSAGNLPFVADDPRHLILAREINRTFPLPAHLGAEQTPVVMQNKSPVDVLLDYQEPSPTAVFMKAGLSRD